MIAGTTGYADLYLGCNAKLDGILEVWKGIDYYIIQADRLLCSPLCPCNIKDGIAYSQSEIFKHYYDSWTKSNEIYDAVNFQGCHNNVKNLAYEETIKLNPKFNEKNDFDANRLFDFMARVENEFNCAGWCQQSYIMDGSEKLISKYLFTDINRYDYYFLN